MVLLNPVDSSTYKSLFTTFLNDLAAAKKNLDLDRDLFLQARDARTVVTAAAYSKFAPIRDTCISGYKINSCAWFDLVKPDLNAFDPFYSVYEMKERLVKYAKSEDLVKDIAAGKLTAE